MSLNQVSIIGNLGANPKSAGTETNPIFNFSVATNYEYKDRVSGEKKTETEWHRVAAFGQIARYLQQYASTGRQVFVQGRLRTRKYEKDGVAHSVTEIIADTVNLLGANPERSENATAPQQRSAPAPQQRQAASTPALAPATPAREVLDDEIPF